MKDILIYWLPAIAVVFYIVLVGYTIAYGLGFRRGVHNGFVPTNHNSYCPDCVRIKRATAQRKLDKKMDRIYPIKRNDRP